MSTSIPRPRSRPASRSPSANPTSRGGGLSALRRNKDSSAPDLTLNSNDSNKSTRSGLSPAPSFRRRLSRSRHSPDRLLSPGIGDGDADDASSRRVSVDDKRSKSPRHSRRSFDGRVGVQEPESKRGNRFVSRIRRRRNESLNPDVLDTRSRNSSTARSQHSGSNSPMERESEHSSLFTDESPERREPEDIFAAPTLSRRESHTGYLTLSSPEINSRTTPLTSPVQPTFEAATSTERFPDIPQIVEPTDDEHAPSAPAIISPVERALGTRSRTSSNASATSQSKAVGNRIGALGGLFRSTTKASSVQSQDFRQQEQDSSERIDSNDAVITESQPQEPATPTQSRQRKRINTPDLLATPPNLVETPETFVTPPTPPGRDRETPTAPLAPESTPARPTTSAGDVSTRQSADNTRHRRAYSANLPPRASQTLGRPLSPTVEEARTPGGTLTQPNNNSGFFSSVFSVAQRAAEGWGTQRSRPVTPQATNTSGGEKVIPGVEQLDSQLFNPGPPLAPAVETLGQGNLSLSQLGISDNPKSDSMNSVTDLHKRNVPFAHDFGDGNRKIEQEAAARAVSSAYEKPTVATSESAGSRPISIASTERLTLGSDPHSLKADGLADGNGLQRSGSVRSRISGHRRHRTSSATVGTTNSIAAAIKDSSLGMASLAANGQGHRLTGFAVASSKRNKDFHQLFRSVPEDDYLIEDYSAALQRDILLHGRLYVSEGHICFSSNILGWVTNLVISFDELTSVEKRNTAVIFPNAIVISTQHARNTFASFVARDSTYDLLIGIWKISHPNLKSSLNGVALDDARSSDKTELADAESEDSDEASNDDENDDDSEDDVYDEDADADDNAGSFTENGAPSEVGSERGDVILSRKASAAPVVSSVPVPPGLGGADSVVVGAAVSSDFPGPQTHAPTECTDADQHYDRPLTDTTIAAPLGKVYSIMFGPASSAFMRKWMVEDQKSRELNYPDDKTGLDNDHKSMTFDYIKPLYNPMGPKQTKCITTNTLVTLDLEKFVTVDCSTLTPDVPSGNIFTCKTRYCLTWAPGNSTRLIANCTIEWTGKSWLKAPIEKGATDGQTEYLKALIASIKAAITTKPPVKGIQRKGKKRGKREVFDADEAVLQRRASISADHAPQNWGLFDPLRPALSPLTRLLAPFCTTHVAIAILSVLLLYTWLVPSFSRSPASQLSSSPLHHNHLHAHSHAFFDDLWRREESALWDWLDSRVGLDGAHLPLSPQFPHSSSSSSPKRQRNPDVKRFSARVEREKLEGSMSDRQIADAIRTTEERLEALKSAVERERVRRVGKEGEGKTEVIRDKVNESTGKVGV